MLTSKRQPATTGVPGTSKPTSLRSTALAASSAAALSSSVRVQNAQYLRDFTSNSVVTADIDTLLNDLSTIVSSVPEPPSILPPLDSTLSVYLPSKPITSVNSFYSWYSSLQESSTSSSLSHETSSLDNIAYPSDDSDLCDLSVSSLLTENPPTVPRGSLGHDDTLLLAARTDSVSRALDRLHRLQSSLETASDDAERCAARVGGVQAEVARLSARRGAAAAFVAALERRLWALERREILRRRLEAPSSSVQGPVSSAMLSELDEAISFVAAHSDYRVAPEYLRDFATLMQLALRTVTDHVCALIAGALTTAQQQQEKDRRASPSSASAAAGAVPSSPVSAGIGMDSDPAYIQFRVLAATARPHIADIEKRAFSSFRGATGLSSSSTAAMLAECHSAYFHARIVLLEPPLRAQMAAICPAPTAPLGDTDLPTVVREACAYTARVCRLETGLFGLFFESNSALFTKLLEEATQPLYDALCPLLVREKSIDSLCAACAVLRQYASANVSNSSGNSNDGSFSGFENDAIDGNEGDDGNGERKTGDRLGKGGPFQDVLERLVRSAQERLTYVAQMIVRSEVVLFKPKDSDLAYPEKLTSSTSFTTSISDSLSSPSRNTDDAEVSLLLDNIQKLYSSWYPTVRTTLVLLSKLYLTVETRVFEGLAHESVDACLDSLFRACESVTARSGILDGQLFLIKHLLVLKEQIAPFNVSFTQVTLSLDFSHLRQELRKVIGGGFSALFSLDTYAPRLRAESRDSKKKLDDDLTLSIETFIVYWTKRLLQPLLSLLVQVSSFDSLQGSAAQPQQLSQQPWASHDAFCAVADTVRTALTQELPELTRKTACYLSPQQGAALLAPIRDNTLDSWERLRTVYHRACPEDTEDTALPPATALAPLFDGKIEEREEMTEDMDLTGSLSPVSSQLSPPSTPLSSSKSKH